MSVTLSVKLRAAHAEGSAQGLTLMHWCPGCKAPHRIEVEKPNHCNAVWTWDRNAESPTINPSINRVGQCHYFIRSGQIQFCDDSKHALAGQTVELPDYPSDRGHVGCIGAPE